MKSGVMLIVASGKSSRFGGFPKAFCDIGKGLLNAQNTVNYAKKYFEKIYVALNEETYARYKEKLSDCEVIKIKTGHGDAHSLLRSLWVIQCREHGLEDIYFCWGDAVFSNGDPIEEFVAEIEDCRPFVGVACAVDQRPYAWFDIVDDVIAKSHFASDEPAPEEGVHDQSLFFANLDFMISSLTSYRNELGIDEKLADVEGIEEMKLLYWFDRIYCDQAMPSARAVNISRGNINSFNTQKELNAVKKRLSVG